MTWQDVENFFQSLWDRFLYYLNTDTELVIWLTIIALIIILAAGSVYSTAFRRTVAITAVLTALLLWAIDRFYFQAV